MRFILTIILTLLTQVGHAQDPELLGVEWYLQEVQIDGTSYFRPNPDFRAIAQFLFDIVEVIHPLCEEGFSTDVVYTNLDEFNIDDTGIALIGSCPNPNQTVFKNKHYELYLIDDLFARNPFTYSINNGSNGKTLTVINGDGDIGIYGDQLLSSGDIRESEFIIYPNPVDDILYIENVNNNQIRMITVYDVLGRVIIEVKENVAHIDLSNLKRGLVLLKIETENGTLVTEIAKR